MNISEKIETIESISNDITKAYMYGMLYEQLHILWQKEQITQEEYDKARDIIISKVAEMEFNSL